MDDYISRWYRYASFFNKGLSPKQYGIMLSKKRRKKKW